MTSKQKHELEKANLEMDYKHKEAEFQKAYKRYLLHSLKKDEFGIYLEHENYEEFREMAIAKNWKSVT